MENTNTMTGKVKQLSVKKILRMLDVMGLRSKGSANGINKKDLYKLNLLTKLNVIVYVDEVVILDDLSQKNMSTLISVECLG